MSYRLTERLNLCQDRTVQSCFSRRSAQNAAAMHAATIDAFGEGQRRLLTLLLETKGGLTADDLAERLAVSRSAVHQHLTALERDGFVAKSALASNGGRPGYGWTLTDGGVHLFPKQYALLASLLVGALKATLLSADVVRVLRALGEKLASEHAARLRGKTRKEQIAIVAEIMRELGYRASAAGSRRGSAADRRAQLRVSPPSGGAPRGLRARSRAAVVAARRQDRARRVHGARRRVVPLPAAREGGGREGRERRP